jgi:hypothetical protein
MAQSPEIQAKIAVWRQKSLAGTLTQEEMREAIAILRQDRIGASVTSAGAREKKATTRAKASINSDDLLNQLDGL